MSYKGDDKWECFCDRFSMSAKTVKELKEGIRGWLATMYINQYLSDYRSQDYELVVKFSIRKKK